MFTSGLLPLPIALPRIWQYLELARYQFQQWLEWVVMYTQHHAGIAHIAKLYGKSKPVGGASPLSDDGQISIVEGVEPNQLIFGVGQSEQAFVLSGGQNRTAWHVHSFLETRVFESSR
jgi:hypothetical protein